jgi:hypothetical protein
MSGGGYWPKATAAGATALHGSGGGSPVFLLHMQTTANAPGASGAVWAFGDFSRCAVATPGGVLMANNTMQPRGRVTLGMVEYSSASSGNNAMIPRSFTAAYQRRAWL